MDKTGEPGTAVPTSPPPQEKIKMGSPIKRQRGNGVLDGRDLMIRSDIFSQSNSGMKITENFDSDPANPPEVLAPLERDCKKLAVEIQKALVEHRKIEAISHASNEELREICLKLYSHLFP